MILIILLISFFLDGFLLSTINSNSLFFPLCSLMAMIIIYPFFKKSDYNKFLIVSGIMGMFYDLVYMNTLLLNIGLFLLMAVIIKIVFFFYSNNLISNLLIGSLLVCLYRVIIYLVLVLGNYLNFSFLELLKGIYSTLLLNVIYIIIFYFVTLNISKKHKIPRDN